VFYRKALLARFFHPERQREQPILAAGFRRLQHRGDLDDIAEMPSGVTLEGAGDCIWDRHRRLFWIGSGFRSDRAAAKIVEDYFGACCVPLALADASFYHLDTAFCALPHGDVIYYPGAFSPSALAAIHDHVAADQRIALDRADAARFAANAVCIDRAIVMSSCSVTLRRVLEDRGYRLVKTPLHAFLRSGGSACCLTLRLDHASRSGQALAVEARAGLPRALRLKNK
jgi:N-dimethylarginine dimethylaminohydrolase